MAIETTTVQGKVVMPDGTGATGGTIRATLSAPGSVSDGSIDNEIGGSFEGTIAGDGTITGLVLVPNDVITPATTYYIMEFIVTSPIRARWTVNRTIDTAPDPVDVGDLSAA